MKSIKEKAEEYAKTKHTNKNLIEIVSWDFEAGATYVIDEIEELLSLKKQYTDKDKFIDDLEWRIEQLKSNHK